MTHDRPARGVTSAATCDCGGRPYEIGGAEHRVGCPETSAAGEAQPWRVGSHYGIHVYEGDRPIATFHTAEDARQAVADHNDEAGRAAVEALASLRAWLRSDAARRMIAEDIDESSGRLTIPEQFHVAGCVQAGLISATSALDAPDADQASGVPDGICLCDGAAYFTDEENAARQPFIVHPKCSVHVGTADQASGAGDE